MSAIREAAAREGFGHYYVHPADGRYACVMCGRPAWADVHHARRLVRRANDQRDAIARDALDLCHSLGAP